ncbi:hypothetical protein EI94DRAFT_1686575 [Lactarius quietus]|nr:hypothetical protein EI94DRAFT_1686575 [Lactarius quietus]
MVTFRDQRMQQMVRMISHGVTFLIMLFPIPKYAINALPPSLSFKVRGLGLSGLFKGANVLLVS